MSQKTVDKILSGRLWLTVITGIVFAYVAFAKILSGEAIATIITAVFTSYFNRHDREKENGSTITPAPKDNSVGH